LQLGDAPEALQLGERFGHAHAASGLLHVAAAVVACHRMAWLRTGVARPWLANAATRQAWVGLSAQGGQRTSVLVRAASPDTRSTPGAVRSGAALQPATSDEPRVWCFGAEDRTDLLAAVSSRTIGGRGPTRLAFV